MFLLSGLSEDTCIEAIGDISFSFSITPFITIFLVLHFVTCCTKAAMDSPLFK